MYLQCTVVSHDNVAHSYKSKEYAVNKAAAASTRTSGRKKLMCEKQQHNNDRYNQWN